MKSILEFPAAIFTGHYFSERHFLNRKSLKIMMVFSILVLALSFFN